MEIFLMIIYYIAVGFLIEVFVNAFMKIPFLFDNKNTDDDRLVGWVPLWMLPVYAIGLPFIFLPLYTWFISIGMAFYFRFLIWAIAITGMEVLTGLFYDKGLNFITRGKFSVKPWTYVGYKDSIIFGYTRWSLIPAWGIAGLFLELISYVSLKSVVLQKVWIIEFFKNFF